MASLAEKLRTGCSGWGYEFWLGGFYPPGTTKPDYLKVYSSVFDCVEVDSSFYRSPDPLMTRRWSRSTPPGFLFAMKMPKRITHEKKLSGVSQNLESFYTAAKELGEKCGPLVAQLPPSVKYDAHWPLMQEFVHALDLKRFPHAIEFRHRSWFREDVYALLRDRGVALVWTENQYLRSPAAITADYVYLRMIGDRELTELGQIQRDKSAEMRAWYGELEGAADSIGSAFAFFNNHFAGFGPGSVNEFRRLAGLREYSFPSATSQASAGQRNLGEFG